MERNKNKIKIVAANPRTGKTQLTADDIDWEKINVDEFMLTEEGSKIVCDAINKGYNKFCQDRGLDPNRPETWPSA